ncbi:hypothetical protein IMZ48_15740 [Candidatus Bathyarchaeota archaeon]|nr:hypothetical protein [Candidatus Bathyarchaeota archaeon]
MSVVSLRLRNAYSRSGPVGVCVFEERIHISQGGKTGETTFKKTIDELKLTDYLVFEFEGTGPPVGEPVSLVIAHWAIDIY